MAVTPTQHFTFLANIKGISIERNEFHNPVFNRLRSGIRGIISQLRESEDPDARDISNRARQLLFEWLAAPVKFDDTILRDLREIGDPEEFVHRWGIVELSACIKAASELVQDGEKFPSPLRTQVRTRVQAFRTEKVSFRIYCRQSIRVHFDSIYSEVGDLPLADSIFIHTLSDYRQTGLFDVLIKVGPFRSTGISGMPDSILSAPKFPKLIQFVWSGCADEDGMGLDPTTTGGNFLESLPEKPRQQLKIHISDNGWNPVQNPAETRNEFAMFKEPICSGEKSTAVLVEIGDGDGRLFPPCVSVLSFDPRFEGTEAVDFREVSGEMSVGAYLIIPRIGDLDSSGSKPEHHISLIWKSRLKKQLQNAPDALCSELRNGGVYLKTLASRVRYWALDADEKGIHAPMEMRHFQILIKCLEKDEAMDPQEDWWHSAWVEIQASRSAARQAGREESQNVKSQELSLLRSLLAEIRALSANADGFSVQIPAGRKLNGRFVFYKVPEIREGYLVPCEMLWQVFNVEDVEQWKLV